MPYPTARNPLLFAVSHCNFEIKIQVLISLFSFSVYHIRGPGSDQMKNTSSRFNVICSQQTDFCSILQLPHNLKIKQKTWKMLTTLFQFILILNDKDLLNGKSTAQAVNIYRTLNHTHKQGLHPVLIQFWVFSSLSFPNVNIKVCIIFHQGQKRFGTYLYPKTLLFL